MLTDIKTVKGDALEGSSTDYVTCSSKYPILFFRECESRLGDIETGVEVEVENGEYKYRLKIMTSLPLTCVHLRHFLNKKRVATNIFTDIEVGKLLPWSTEGVEIEEEEIDDEVVCRVHVLVKCIVAVITPSHDDMFDILRKYGYFDNNRHIDFLKETLVFGDENEPIKFEYDRMRLYNMQLCHCWNVTLGDNVVKEGMEPLEPSKYLEAVVKFLQEAVIYV
jgi:hypothetical protein